MQIPGSILTPLIVAASVGVMVAINLMIAGLIIIAVVHDGATAADVAGTFQQLLQSSITALGVLLSGIITGRIVLAHMQARTEAEHQQQQQQQNGGTP